MYFMSFVLFFFTFVPVCLFFFPHLQPAAPDRSTRLNTIPETQQGFLFPGTVTHIPISHVASRLLWELHPFHCTPCLPRGMNAAHQPQPTTQTNNRPATHAASLHVLLVGRVLITTSQWIRWNDSWFKRWLEKWDLAITKCALQTEISHLSLYRWAALQTHRFGRRTVQISANVITVRFWPIFRKLWQTCLCKLSVRLCRCQFLEKETTTRHIIRITDKPILK